MSCDFVEGRYTNCRDGIPGVNKFWLTKFENINQTSGYTITSGTVTAMTQAAGTKFWQFDLEQENGDFKEVFTGSTETWNGFWKQTLVWNQFTLSAKNRNLIASMVQMRLMGIFLMNDGTYFVIGITRSATIPSIAAQSGKKMGEMNGYTTTLEANEPLEAIPMSSSCFQTLSIGQ